MIKNIRIRHKIEKIGTFVKLKHILKGEGWYHVFLKMSFFDDFWCLWGVGGESDSRIVNAH